MADFQKLSTFYEASANASNYLLLSAVQKKMKSLYKYLLNTLPRPLLIRLSYIFRLFTPLIFKGNAVACPVCNKKFSKFLSYGSEVAHRENVLCPNCLSLERHRLLWIYLQEHTGFFKDELKVLHMAPEQCFYGRFKKLKNLDYLCGDLYSPLADIKFDLHDIPLEDNLFDVVLCNHVLEHVADDHQCMKELYRVMKPGGFAILQVPIDYSREHTYEDPSITSPEEREKHFWQKDHLRLYGRDYPQKLEAAGFKVKEVKLATEMSEAQARHFRIQRSEIIYRGEK